MNYGFVTSLSSSLNSCRGRDQVGSTFAIWTSPHLPFASRIPPTTARPRRPRTTRQDIVGEPVQAIAQMPDERLIAYAELASRNRGQPRFEYGLEMQRRLKMATEKLTAELVTFRESAERRPGGA
jgi:hypothetical protein